MDLKEIQNLIKFVAKSGTSEVKLETDDFKITIKTGPTGNTMVQQLVAAPITQAATTAGPLEVAQTQPVAAAAPEDHLQTNHCLLRSDIQFQKVMFYV